MLLTILIPTYNRSSHLSKSLNRLVELQKLGLLSSVETVVAVNACKDQTLSICNSMKSELQNLCIENFSEFVYSAESNIARSIPKCSGDYIFILGDDDEVDINTFKYLIEILKKSDKKIPAFIFGNTFNEVRNAIVLDEKNELVDFRELVKKYGLITTMSFISRYVIRRDLISDFSDKIAISRIYSHVFAFISFFHNQKVLVSDLPLVCRNVTLDNAEIVDNFVDMANDLGQSYYFPWTEGILLHFEDIVKKNIVSKSWFFEITEHDAAGKTMLWKKVLNMMLQRCSAYIAKKSLLEKPTEKCAEILRSFDQNVLNDFDKKIFQYALSKYSEVVFELSREKFFNLERHKFLKSKLKKVTSILNIDFSALKSEKNSPWRASKCKFEYNFLLMVKRILSCLKKESFFMERKIFAAEINLFRLSLTKGL